MFAVDELKSAGFDVWVDAWKIRYKQVTEGPVDETWINNLLQSIKEHKQEAIQYLQPSPCAHNSISSDPPSTAEPMPKVEEATSQIVPIKGPGTKPAQGAWSIVNIPDGCRVTDPASGEYQDLSCSSCAGAAGCPSRMDIRGKGVAQGSSSASMPTGGQVKVDLEGAQLVSRSVQYLAGISDDLTGWSLWERIEQGKRHRFAIDAAGVIRWERWYSVDQK